MIAKQTEEEDLQKVMSRANPLSNHHGYFRNQPEQAVILL